MNNDQFSRLCAATLRDGEHVSVPRELIARLEQFGEGSTPAAAVRRDVLNQIYILLAQPAEQPQGEPVAWAPVKPTVPGAYWVRGNGLDQDALIQVIDEDGELRCNLHQRTTEADFGWGYAVADLSEEFEWLGPLFAHADPGEVERLRDALDECDGDRWKLRTERDTLRAKLAERDALLRELADAPPAAMEFKLQQKVKAAMSASAEPSAPVERDERAEFDDWKKSGLGVAGVGADLAAWQAWQARAALERKP